MWQYAQGGCSRCEPLIDSSPLTGYITWLVVPPYITVGAATYTRAPAGALLRLEAYMGRVAIFVDAGYLFAQGSLSKEEAEEWKQRANVRDSNEERAE